ncbi:MAG TPA: divalent-cation tolerance protein CutA [Longimicrobiales bacterium]
MSTDVVVGMVTTPDRAMAEAIVDRLVGERLIACGNILASVTSIYRWQGEVERADEVLIILKTTEALAAHVVARVRELHSYEVPEVLFFPVTKGNDAYVQWVRESVRSAQDIEG